MKDGKNIFASKAVKNVSSQTFVSLSLGLIEIISFSVLSRLLSRQDFGYFASISAIVLIFAVFSDTGIGAAIIQKKNINKDYINNAFTISFIFGLLLSGLLFVFSGLLAEVVVDDKMKIPLMIMAPTILLNCLASVNRSIMYKKMLFLRVGFLQIAAQLITVIVTILFAVSGAGYYSIITKSVLYSFLFYLFSLYEVRQSFRFTLDIKVARSIFNFSGWLMASSVFREISNQIDRLLMPKLLSVELLGAYNRPKEFLNHITQKINGVFDTALFPLLSSIQDDLDELKNAFMNSFYYINLFSSLLSLGFVINSELIFRIFFGEEWLDLAVVLRIFAMAILFNSCGRLADCFLRSLAMTRIQFYFRVMETLLKISSVLIGYKWGIVGVAFSIASVDIFVKMIKILYVGRKLEITLVNLLQTMFKSWKYTLFMIPVLLISNYFLTDSYASNLFLFLLFISVAIIEFFVFPQTLGKKYSNEMHAKILSVIKYKK